MFTAVEIKNVLMFIHVLHALSKYEKTVAAHAAWTAAIQWSVTTHYSATNLYLLFGFLKKKKKKFESLLYNPNSGNVGTFF